MHHQLSGCATQNTRFHKISNTLKKISRKQTTLIFNFFFVRVPFGRIEMGHFFTT